jgi:long-chain acyl-CoA synthetase
MKEYSTPTNAKVRDNEIIPSMLDQRLARDKDKIIIKYKDKNENWIGVKTSEFDHEIIDVAKGIMASDINRGDAVAIMAPTSYDWVLIDFVCLSLGIVVIPIYDTSSVSQVKHILKDSGAKLCFVGTKDTKEKVRLASSDIEIQVFEDDCIGSLKVIGESIPTEQFRYEKSLGKADDLATIIYTSGSTGTPKGGELTHRSFLSILYGGMEGMPELLLREPEARLLLFLPVAHVFARYLEFVAIGGTSVLALSSDMKTLIPDLEYFKPTFMLGVPRVFEKVFNSASQKAGGGLKGKIFKQATRIAVAYSKNEQKGKKAGKSLTFWKNTFDKLVYGQIRSVLGGKVEYLVAGGAPMSAELAHYFCGIGLPMLQGYGLTESSAPAMVNRVNNNVIGSVGQPLPGVTVKIGDDNEILIKSDQVFNGYHNMKELTKETLKNGWLHTGDEGKILKDGSVVITGRIKDILVTAGGKNVSPIPLEEIITQEPFIAEAVVLGDKKPFISVVVTLDYDIIEQYFKEKGLKYPKNSSELIDNPLINNKVINAVDKANQTVSHAEAIKKHLVLDITFSEDNGLMTPTQKVKRNAVIKKFTKQIDTDIYGEKK